MSDETSAREAQVEAVHEVLKSILEPCDWTAIRADEAKVLVPLTEASVLAGGVFERMVISMFAKVELDDAFLKVNNDRGLLVLGAVKPDPQPKGRSKKVLKKEIQEAESGSTTADIGEVGEAVHVPGFTSESLGDSVDGEGEPTEEDPVAPASTDMPDVSMEDSQIPSPAPASPPPEKDDKKLLDKSAVPAPQKALHEQLKALQCPDADLTVLQQQQQLKKNAREEKAAKVLARAAGKGGGRGKKKSGTSDAAGVVPEGEQADTEPSHTENPETGVPNEDQTDEPGHTENPQTDQDQTEEPGHENPETGVPDEDQTKESGNAGKPKPKGPKRAQATAENSGEAKKQKTTKETRTVADVHKDLYKMNNIGLRMPTAAELKQKSYTIHDPSHLGSGVQVLPNHNGFYVLHMKQQQWFVDVAKAHLIQANECKKGCAVNWQKHGMDYGWRLSMVLAGWFERPQGLDPSDTTAIREYISKGGGALQIRVASCFVMDARVYPLSLSGSAAAMLLALGVPTILLQAAHYVATIADEQHCRDDLMILEAFSGVGRVAASFEEQGSTFDVLTSPFEENILSTVGLLNLLKKTLRIREARGPQLNIGMITNAVQNLEFPCWAAAGLEDLQSFLIAEAIRGHWAMVDKALQQHGKKDKPDGSASDPRPLATPARPPIKTPVIETPPAAPAAPGPSPMSTESIKTPAAAPTAPGPSPMSTGSIKTPAAAPAAPGPSPMSTGNIKSPDAKRHRSVSSLSLTASEVPRLPSFSESSTKPRHSDSSTTISLNQYMAELSLDKGLSQDLAGTQLEEETKGSQLFCGVACFLKSVETPTTAAVETAAHSEPDPESAPAAKATQAEVETQLDPVPTAAVPPRVEVEQPASKASVSFTAEGTTATAEADASSGHVRVAASCSPFSAKASVEGTEKSAEGQPKSANRPDELEMHLERLLDEQDEVEAAQHRAEQRAQALQSLLAALLQQPAELSGARSGFIRDMLRRPATCDIEAMTRQLEHQVETGPESAGPVVHMQDVKTEFVEPADLPEKTQKEGVPAESSTKESVPAGVPADVPAESSTKESVPAGAVETSTKESVPAGAVETETKESAPAGVKVETSTKESVPASVKVETETKESVPPGKAETETKESVPPGKVETDTAVEPRVTPKPKPNREEETEEERKAREAHNSYMRCFRSLRSLAGHL
ncbi:unnamed protein product [Symbiodinium sp. CCMP2592]|nr:unnamed protein product [Symbiodinium sp. CCMP2592]